MRIMKCYSPTRNRIRGSLKRPDCLCSPRGELLSVTGSGASPLAEKVVQSFIFDHGQKFGAEYDSKVTEQSNRERHKRIRNFLILSNLRDEVNDVSNGRFDERDVWQRWVGSSSESLQYSSVRFQNSLSQFVQVI